MTMKKKIFMQVLALAAILSGAHAQQNGDTTARYYYRLATSKEAADRELLSGKLYGLLQTDNEKDWMMAWQYFYTMKKNAVADSIEGVIKTKFPSGEYWRGKEVSMVYDAKGAAAKEAAYLAWKDKYPPARFTGSTIFYDYASNDVARAYAEEKNVQKAILYADMVTTPAWKGEGWAGVGMELEKNGFINEATELYKKATNNAYQFKTTRKTEDGADFAAHGYRGYCNYYAGGLLRQKKYDSALVYVRKALAEGKPDDPSINGKYAKILAAMGKDQEAYAKADSVVRTGLADNDLKSLHKELYTRLHPGGKGYDVYLTDMQREITRNVIANLQHTMIDQPSPAFVLKDVKGNTVSTEELKGKTVVLDFWATWCGPCKRSFPAMQMAVNKYKDDPNVKFLFIHTWEKGEDDPTAAARKYIEDNHFSFQVLMDLKDAESKSNKVVEAFGIQGIPTKFVLDRNGRIRFRITGFSGGDEAAVEELSAMIELVKKS